MPTTEFDSCFANALTTISLRTARTTKPPSGNDKYLGVVTLGENSKSVLASDIAATLDIAPDFSGIVSYTKDDFVYRDGRFYCAKEDIPAGAWNSSKWLADPSLCSILLQKIRAIVPVPSTTGRYPGDVLTVSSNGQGVEWAAGGCYVKNGGVLTDAANVNVPNNSLSTLTTLQSTLTLNVNCAENEVPNFAVEITAGVAVTLTVTKTVGNTITTLCQSSAGGNALDSGKYYQITAVGNCWTLAEFALPSA